MMYESSFSITEATAVFFHPQSFIKFGVRARFSVEAKIILIRSILIPPWMRFFQEKPKGINYSANWSQALCCLSIAERAHPVFFGKLNLFTSLLFGKWEGFRGNKISHLRNWRILIKFVNLILKLFFWIGNFKLRWTFASTSYSNLMAFHILISFAFRPDHDL